MHVHSTQICADSVSVVDTVLTTCQSFTVTVQKSLVAEAGDADKTVKFYFKLMLY